MWMIASRPTSRYSSEERMWRTVMRRWLMTGLAVASLVWVMSSSQSTAQDDKARQREQRGKQLQQLVIAMHKHHEDFMRVPQVAYFSRQGKPLLSWRVHLLPYLVRDDLLKQFRMDEPWDSPHNKQFLK